MSSELPRRFGKRHQDNSGVAVGRRWIEKSSEPPHSSTPFARSGVLVPKKALVRANAMPTIAAMPELGGAPVAKAAPGSWKTIDQRERVQVRARRQHARGILNIAGGLTVATAASSANGRSIPNAVHAGRNLAGRDRPMLLQGKHPMDHQIARVPWRDADEPVRAGLRRRAQYAGRIARRSPAVAVAGGGLAMMGYGATQMARGRVKEAYQQRRINARRKANAERFGKADRYYDPEDRRQRRLGAYGAGGALVGGRLAYTGARGIAEDTRHARNLPMDLARPRENGRFVAMTEKTRAGRAAVNFIRAGSKHNKPLLVRPSRLGRVGAGTALLAGSAALVRHGDDPRRRRWR